ncbi:oligosaccharide flippase family protein [Novosphingobium sp. FKTRR1]|uniref:oligosaccharide flippase family protein n=1 Tax=Novosphingobium sp. FKTRR1 TaxID=2879118 RepID=UPI001CF0B41B|nr:oligosaccharide flippase family protein [Novosphingobium sp. FKTRR1]
MIRNVSITSTINIYRAFIQFGLNIALARFLLPSDFGQVAFVLPISLLILLLGDFGITVAVVRGSANPREVGAVATICATFGAAMFVISAALYSAGVFASWPGQTPQLVVTFALVAMIAMTAVIPRALLERSLAYGRIAGIETTANTAAFAAAITAAWMGWGVWSFAAYHLTIQTVRSALFWIFAGNRLALNFNWRLAQALMGFGGWVGAFNVINYFARNLDNFIVGAMLGTAQLGLYALAYQIMLVPLTVITWPASNVLLSTISRVRDRPNLLRDSHLAMVRLTAMVTFPIMTLVSLRGGMVFDILLPERWHDLGQLTSRMALAGGLQSTTSFIGALFVVQGRVRLQLVSGIVATTFILSSIAVAAVFGGTLSAVANTYLAATVLMSAGYYFGMAGLLQVPLTRVLGAVAPGALSSALGVLAVLGLDAILPLQTPALAQLVIDCVAYGLAALAVLGWQRLAIMQSLTAMRSASTAAAD